MTLGFIGLGIMGAPMALRLLGGGQVVLANVPAGTLLPIRAARVLASGTTAAHVVGFW
jgi:3-hydroxyisobutyrate dehydrogenase-like beta-hydroxyacid dehydrogenase